MKASCWGNDRQEDLAGGKAGSEEGVKNECADRKTYLNESFRRKINAATLIEPTTSHTHEPTADR